jgi:two-component system heavy metal sensor histidine kinase CusS
MFLKPTESRSRSITSQLVFLFTVAATLLLGLGLGVLYWIVVRHAFEEDNLALADKIVALRTDLGQGADFNSLKAQVKAGRAAEATAYSFRIIDSSARVVAETEGMNEMLSQSIFPKPQRIISSVRNPVIYRTRGKLFSLVATIEDSAGQSYTMQIAQDRSEDDHFARQFRTLLVVVLASGIFASSVLAISVTKRVLRPLSEMTDALGRFGPTRLHERAPPGGWPPELQPLAIAFNDMLDRLEDSFTRLSRFSADLAHELRTPIANILGEAEVALTRARTTDEYRGVIESNIGEYERLSGIIDNLLFLARAEAADREIHRTIFDGAATVSKIVEYYKTIAEDRHIAISCSGEGNVYADPVLFGRAVSNLVDNAVKFTRDGGIILIKTAVQAAHAEVSVSDNGCGISAEHIPRIFDRFYRADASRSSQGTGLGLALVKSIVDLHGGSVEAKSEVNHGTTIVLTFPQKVGT